MIFIYIHSLGLKFIFERVQLIEKIFLKISKKILALYRECAIIKMSKGGKAFQGSLITTYRYNRHKDMANSRTDRHIINL